MDKGGKGVPCPHAGHSDLGLIPKLYYQSSILTTTLTVITTLLTQNQSLLTLKPILSTILTTTVTHGMPNIFCFYCGNLVLSQSLD